MFGHLRWPLRRDFIAGSLDCGTRASSPKLQRWFGIGSTRAAGGAFELADKFPTCLGGELRLTFVRTCGFRRKPCSANKLGNVFFFFIPSEKAESARESRTLARARKRVIRRGKSAHTQAATRRLQYLHDKDLRRTSLSGIKYFCSESRNTRSEPTH